MARPHLPTPGDGEDGNLEMLRRTFVFVAVVVMGLGFMSVAAVAAPSEKSSKDQICNGDPSGQSNTGHGANNDGGYQNTCPAGESQNGNGGGQASGKPCAGCVGNADDKNPKGQYPDGVTDSNRGYECDRNHGIGRGNPAHTGCTGSTGSTNPAAPAVLGNSGSRGGSTPVTPTQPTQVLGESFFRLAGSGSALGPKPVEVLGANFTRGQALPMTGSSDLMWLALVGTGLIVVGLFGVSFRSTKNVVPQNQW